MRCGLNLSDVPPRGYHSEGYWAAKIVHDFYASGDEVWELTAQDLPNGEFHDKYRSALLNAMTRHGSGHLVSRGNRMFLIAETP